MHKPQNWLGILAQQLSTTVQPNIGNDYSLRRKRYNNHQLWRLLPSTESQIRFLEEYRLSPEGAKLQWWKGPTLRYEEINNSYESFQLFIIYLHTEDQRISLCHQRLLLMLRSR